MYRSSIRPAMTPGITNCRAMLAVVVRPGRMHRREALIAELTADATVEEDEEEEEEEDVSPGSS
jgi:hypothetical protein